MIWEYKETGRITERAMNELGKDGWELVFVLDAVGVRDKMFWKRIIQVPEETTLERKYGI